MPGVGLEGWPVNQTQIHLASYLDPQHKGGKEGSEPGTRVFRGVRVRGARFGAGSSPGCSTLRCTPSPISCSSCLTAHSNPAQQFQQESEEACIQLKPQGVFREAEGNFPSWNMARIQGLISWLLGKQSWDLCSLRVILISVLSRIWKKKGKGDKGNNPSKKPGLQGATQSCSHHREELLDEKPVGSPGTKVWQLLWPLACVLCARGSPVHPDRAKERSRVTAPISRLMLVIAFTWTLCPCFPLLGGAQRGAQQKGFGDGGLSHLLLGRTSRGHGWQGDTSSLGYPRTCACSRSMWQPSAARPLFVPSLPSAVGLQADPWRHSDPVEGGGSALDNLLCDANTPD